MIGIISIADISLRTSGIVINSILFGSFHQNSNCKWNNCLSIGSIIDYFPNLNNGSSRNYSAWNFRESVKFVS